MYRCEAKNRMIAEPLTAEIVMSVQVKMVMMMVMMMLMMRVIVMVMQLLSFYMRYCLVVCS